MSEFDVCDQPLQQIQYSAGVSLKFPEASEPSPRR